MSACDSHRIIAETCSVCGFTFADIVDVGVDVASACPVCERDAEIARLTALVNSPKLTAVALERLVDRFKAQIACALEVEPCPVTPEQVDAYAAETGKPTKGAGLDMAAWRAERERDEAATRVEPEPRYDDVFFAGVEWLNASDDADTSGSVEADPPEAGSQAIDDSHPRCICGCAWGNHRAPFLGSVSSPCMGSVSSPCMGYVGTALKIDCSCRGYVPAKGA